MGRKPEKPPERGDNNPPLFTEEELKRNFYGRRSSFAINNADWYWHFFSYA